MTEPSNVLNARGGANLLNIGTKINTDMTSEEVLRNAGLDFNVRLEQCKTSDGEDMVGISGNQYTVRDDTGQVLGNGMSKGYGIVQNEVVLGMIEEFNGHAGSTIERIGSRRNGANWFCVAKMPQEYNVVVGNEDPAQVYAVFQNSHDGSGSLKVTFTCIRMGCSNQMPMFSAMAQIKLTHTTNILKRLLQEVDNILFKVRASIETYEVSYNTMIDTKIDRESAIDLIDDLIGSKMGMYKSDKNDKDSEKVLKFSGRHENIRDTILDNLNHESNNIDNMRGTVWAVYNAFTYYIDHQRIINSTTGELKPEGQLNAVFNAGRLDRQKAVNKCLLVC